MTTGWLVCDLELEARRLAAWTRRVSPRLTPSERDELAGHARRLARWAVEIDYDAREKWCRQALGDYYQARARAVEIGLAARERSRVDLCKTKWRRPTPSRVGRLLASARRFLRF